MQKRLFEVIGSIKRIEIEIEDKMIPIESEETYSKYQEEIDTLETALDMFKGERDTILDEWFKAELKKREIVDDILGD